MSGITLILLQEHEVVVNNFHKFKLPLYEVWYLPSFTSQFFFFLIRIHTHMDTHARYYIKGITSPGSPFESSIVSSQSFYLSIFIAI